MFYKDDGRLQEMADSLIEEKNEFNALTACNIGFLYSDKEKKSKGRRVFADTEKLNDKMKLLTGYDFIITFYLPNLERVSDRAKEIVMFHELKHCGYDVEDGSCYLIPHDLEDFKEIIDEYGSDWIKS